MTSRNQICEDDARILLNFDDCELRERARMLAYVNFLTQIKIQFAVSHFAFYSYIYLLFIQEIKLFISFKKYARKGFWGFCFSF